MHVCGVIANGIRFSPSEELGKYSYYSIYIFNNLLGFDFEMAHYLKSAINKCLSSVAIPKSKRYVIILSMFTYKHLVAPSTQIRQICSPQTQTLCVGVEA